MDQTTRIPRIVRPEPVIQPPIEIIVPYAAGELVYIHPPVGTNTYQKVGKELLKKGLRLPTGDQTVALLHAAFCVPEVYDEPEFQDIRDIIKNKWLWAFQVNRWTDKGVYV